MARLGILGGTFNPPHVGHLAVAQAARVQLELDPVLLMPASASPFKAGGEQDPGADHRLAMCRLACEHEPGLRACELEVRRGGASYTVDTLREIHAIRSDAELTFILGADTARTLPAWREPRALLAMARLAVAARSGAAHDDVLGAVASVDPDAAAQVRFLEMPLLDVSASLVRARAAGGQALSGLVPPAVERYILEHGLYGASA